MSESPTEPAQGGALPKHFLAQLESHSPPTSRYENRGEIAHGGMGAILEVWDADLRRTLAMKVIRQSAPRTASEIDGGLLARFLDEAQVTGQLEHPGIVPVHELGLDPDGRVYFTMPLIKGRTLSAVFELVEAGDEEWTMVRALDAILRACEALAYAHSKGVIHRDVKPDNIMVGEFGEVYVMDWGLAKVFTDDGPSTAETEEPRKAVEGVTTGSGARHGQRESSATRTVVGDVVGTPAYMPPEQARGDVDQIGPRSDVYAMGAILYQLLAGHAPYVNSASSLGEILHAIKRGPPVPLSEMDRPIPAGLVEICERAMQRDSEERFADLGEMGRALRGYLGQGLTQARAALKSSRVLRAMSFLAGCFWWLHVLAAVLIVLATVFTANSAATMSFGLPMSIELDEAAYGIEPIDQRIAGVELSDVKGMLNLRSRHWLFRIGTLLPALVVVSFMMLVIHTIRSILRTLKTGTPFTAANVRRIRLLGGAFLGLALVSTVSHSLAPLVASRLVVFEGLSAHAGAQISFTPIGIGCLLLVLAEVFRIGAELETARAK